MAAIPGHSAAYNQFLSVDRVQSVIDRYEMPPRLTMRTFFTKYVIPGGVYDHNVGVNSCYLYFNIFT